MQAAVVSANIGTINESHLGDRLSQAIEQGRRGEFALLLALLSDDAREFAEFSLSADVPLAQKLARRFELPPGAPPRAVVGTKDATDNSSAYRHGDLTDFRLAQALTPEPLVLGAADSQDMLIALGNSSLHARLRQKGEFAALPSPMHFNDVLEAQLSICKRMALYHNAVSMVPN